MKGKKLITHKPQVKLGKKIRLLKKMVFRLKNGWAGVAHTFNPSTREDRGRRISEFKANLVYKN